MSEEELARKWDRCIANTLMRGATMGAAGIAVSFVLFKRRFWPVALFTGLGVGAAYEECAQNFRVTVTAPAPIKPSS
ncbi:hypothetical protein SeMB42_g00984 [Synchytrium endobioticum]|uniref:MICOS complex subunit MIC10 n=1 Tax=Synchytrium endobioticum TaxID=286115 RepID=A0A507D0X1_9FUNG|nr:hypothetical protein SeLEV6574_g04131 [Synchytrium endobioticum]TPX53117.1 hypothetical protein SeMB42_g00984 [Synchytrium endobioticum]